MSESREFRPIPHEFVARAIDKAEHYRLLNEPAEAESICLDVLGLEPENQLALGVLILAITDQFVDGAAATRRARQFLTGDRRVPAPLPGNSLRREAASFFAASSAAFMTVACRMDLRARRTSRQGQPRRDPALEQRLRTIQKAQRAPQVTHFISSY
jgi:hypothetical protein